MPTLYFEFDRRSDFSAPDYFRQRHAYRSPRSSAATNLEIQSFLYSVLKLKKSQGDFAFDFNNTAVRITEGSTESFVLNSQIPESTEQSGLEDLAVRLNTLKARIGALESKRVNTGSYLKSATLAWRAKDVEGLKAPDISGNGFDALFGADGENPTANDPVHLERGDESYLYLPGVAGNYVEIPDSAALDITGDIDIRVAVAMDDWSPSSLQYLISRWAPSETFYLRVTTAGYLRLGWKPSTGAVGQNSSAAIAADDGDLILIRATLDVDNGAGGHDVRFYTKGSSALDAIADVASDSGWTQLGSTVTTAGITEIAATSSKVQVGALSGGSVASGKFYGVVIKDGIDGDTVLDVDFTAGDKTSPRDASLISTATGAWRAASIAPDGSLKDLTGNGRNMAPSGDPTVLDYDGTRYLYLDGQSGNYASVPDEAVLDITGDIDLRADVAGDWSQAINPYLINKQGFGVNGGWFLRIVGGDLYVGWSDGASSNNANSTVPVGSVATDGDRLQVRATLDVDNGASGHDVTFYTRAAGTDLTNDDGWVQLGDVVVVAGVTSIGTASEKVAIGAFHSGSASPFEGGVYAAVVKDGIDGSTVLDIDFTDATQFPDGMDSTSGTASTGQTVTLQGRAMIVDKPALYLDGVDDYFSIPDDDAFDISPGDDATIVVVARMGTYESVSGDRTLFGKGTIINGNVANEAYGLFVREFGGAQSGKIQFKLGDGTSHDTALLPVPDLSSTTVFSASYDADGNYTIWADDETAVNASGGYGSDDAVELTLGMSGGGGGKVVGEILGAAVFVGQVLTADEIAQAGKELSLTFSDTTEFYGYNEARSKVLARTSQVGSIIRSTVDKKSVVVERDVLLFGDAAYMRIMDPEFDFSSDYTIITAVRTHNTPDETQQFFNTGLGAGPAVRLEQTTDDTFKAVQVSGSADIAEIPIVYGHIQIVALGYDTESEEFFLSANGITDKDLTRSAGDPSNDDRDMGIGSNTTGSNNRLDAEMFGMAVYIGRVLTPTEIGIIGRELLGDSNYA